MHFSKNPSLVLLDKISRLAAVKRENILAMIKKSRGEGLGWGDNGCHSLLVFALWLRGESVVDHRVCVFLVELYRLISHPDCKPSHTGGNFTKTVFSHYLSA